MARAPKDGNSGATEVVATTLIFPKKSAWEEAAEAKRIAKKRASSANGTFSTVIARLVEEEHMDRRAARIVLALDSIEDDVDLHTTVFHLIDGIKKLGILKRAQAQEEMFSENKIDTGAISAKKSSKKTDKEEAPEAKEEGNVTHIGAAARKVVEAAGEKVGV